MIGRRMILPQHLWDSAARQSDWSRIPRRRINTLHESDHETIRAFRCGRLEAGTLYDERKVMSTI